VVTSAAVRRELVEDLTGRSVDKCEPLLARAARSGTTAVGEQIGIGDQIATRRNDRDPGVANRDCWTVTGIDDGTLRVHGRAGDRALPAAYVREHVELAYATTVYGAQGETAHLLVGETTGAAAAYVGMPRAVPATPLTWSLTPSTRRGRGGSRCSAVTAPTSDLATPQRLPRIRSNATAPRLPNARACSRPQCCATSRPPHPTTESRAQPAVARHRHLTSIEVTHRP
jgi:hypothetical protein